MLKLDRPTLTKCSKNKGSKQFKKFLQAIDVDTENSAANRNKRWQHTCVSYYVAPQLSEDEHRRDVGNAPSIIFFVERGKQFDTNEVGSLGMVPQIFVVVQPCKEKGWQLGFFSSGNMRPYGPALPKNLTFVDGKSLRDFILTKVHNGNVNFYYSSPMNRRFLMKRQEDIDAVFGLEGPDK